MSATPGTLIGQAFDGTARLLFAAMAIAGVLALLLVLYSEHGKLFRRLNPPERPVVEPGGSV